MLSGSAVQYERVVINKYELRAQKITQIDSRSLLPYHYLSKSLATVCVSHL